MTDRTQPYDTKNTAPTAATIATLFPADEYYENSQHYCKPGNSPLLQPIVPLSYDWTSLKTMINAMQPTGGTNQPIGLAWAWQTLLQTVADERARRGLQLHLQARDHPVVRRSQYRGPLAGLWQRQSQQFGGQIDARQKILCDNIKGVLDPKTGNRSIRSIRSRSIPAPRRIRPRSVLQYCASSTGQVLSAVIPRTR